MSPTLVEENSIRLVSPIRRFYVRIVWRSEGQCTIDVLRIPCQTVHVFDSLEEANDWAWLEAGRKGKEGLAVTLNLAGQLL